MKRLFNLLLTIILCFSSLQSYQQRVTSSCNNYKDHFDSEGSIFTVQDSVNVLKYSQKLFNLYSGISEVYYNGISPHMKIYEMKNYDTALLINLINLYRSDTLKFKKEIGIPFTLATNIIRNDAVIKGRVVNRISDFKECRWFTTSYFIVIDSVIHSYFEINIGDTVQVLTNMFGVEGYCQGDKGLTYGAVVDMKNYKKGEKDVYFLLSRNYIIRVSYLIINKPDKRYDYKDPLCYNSFARSPNNEFFNKKIKACNQTNLARFVKMIKH